MKSNARRILLKISGEALGGASQSGYDGAILSRIARETKTISDQGVEIIIVCGGGNICRGAELRRQIRGVSRTVADHVGMLATVQNGIILKSVLKSSGVEARVLSLLEVRAVAEPFVFERALRHLEKKRVVICAGGTGNPGFSTDTAAITHAIQLEADKVYKATSVDGVFSADPKLDRDARRFEAITYDEFIEKRLRVLDLAAVAMASDNRMPIVVFNMTAHDSISEAVLGNSIGTLISDRDSVGHFIRGRQAEQITVCS